MICMTVFMKVTADLSGPIIRVVVAIGGPAPLSLVGPSLWSKELLRTLKLFELPSCSYLQLPLLDFSDFALLL